jgi:hypothetical protein
MNREVTEGILFILISGNVKSAARERCRSEISSLSASFLWHDGSSRDVMDFCCFLIIKPVSRVILTNYCSPKSFFYSKLLWLEVHKYSCRLCECCQRLANALLESTKFARSSKLRRVNLSEITSTHERPANF